MRDLFSREKWRYLFHTVSHPSDGYYWIRHEGRGSIAIALLLVILYSVVFSLNRIGAGFIVNDIEPRTVNSVAELFGVLVLFFVLCAGNWSVTCLMDGEGRFRDILTVIGYALLPMIVTTVLATLVSRVIAENEEAFYFLIMGAGTAWSLFMMVIGIMQVHNYSFGKTLVTLFLTLAAVLIIIFLALLVIHFSVQVYTFLRSIYTELIFRF